MKFKITLKDPDGFYESIHDVVRSDVEKLGLSKEEAKYLIKERMEELNEKLEKWVKFGEYVTIEFDLENMTASVVEK